MASELRDGLWNADDQNFFSLFTFRMQIYANDPDSRGEGVISCIFQLYASKYTL